MYCILYEFKVKEGQEIDFEKAWSDFTEAIFRVRGSLGSRLHKSNEPHIYIAYAQWPSKEIFEKDVDLSSYTAEEIDASNNMKNCIETSKTVYFLEMTSDHLKLAR